MRKKRYSDGMKKFTVIVFSLAAVILAVLFFNRERLFINNQETVRSRIVTPRAAHTNQKGSDADTSNVQDIQLISFVTLQQTETLINTLSADINADNYDDQVVLIRRTGNPNLILLVGLQSPETSVYQRVFEIQTEISQVRSFSFQALDLTGEHKNSIIYSGITTGGETILKAYLPQTAGGVFSMKLIADLRSDSTIFVQQVQRSDSYFLSQSLGESYPIWVYSTNSAQSTEMLDQIQTLYNWNAPLQAYVQVSQNTVTGKRLAANELARILDGTTETFETFLNGLWFKQQNNKDMRYIFFNPDSREIIFLMNDVQEVYTWTAGMLRRNGMYITAKNSDIENLLRRVDIVLSAADEIRLNVKDDVAMPINEENLWDGSYKKMSGTPFLRSAPVQGVSLTEKAILDSIQTYGDQNWITTTAVSVSFRGNRYIASGSTIQDEGIFSRIVTQNTELLQFRSLTGTGFFSGYYMPRIETEKEANTSQREILTLTPVTVSARSIVPTGTASIRLERENLSGAS